jgi:hypothetical protein
MKHQERILEEYHSFEAVKDCFAISRIENEIVNLSQTALFNQSSRDKLSLLHQELQSILDKYPKLNNI